MNANTIHQAYATSLQTDIRAAAPKDLPRREVLLDWLADFLQRTTGKGFAAAAVDIENLQAMDKFIRVNHVTATHRAAL